jgi:D-alanine-D-alanine ligase
MFAAANMPFTGSDADAIYLSSNKLLAKRWLAVHGVATPAWIYSASSAGPKRGPWIVKSVWEHASLGIDDDSIVRDKEALADRIDSCTRQFGGEWFAERYVDGREFNISLIDDDGEPRILPIAEICFDKFAPDKPRIVGYDAKWKSDTFEYRNTPRVFPTLGVATARKLKTVARKCWKLFKLSGYARVDIRLDKRGMPWVLEINANPCLSSDAGFAAAAAKAGIDFDHVVETIVTVATRQVPRHANGAV